MPVSDGYFVLAGFLLFGHCDSSPEADGDGFRRTLDDLDVGELERLRCLWIGQQDDDAAARETLSATLAKSYRGEERIADVLARAPADEVQRCRDRAAAD